jgi:UDP-4-amino-4,6-dideoxy-N-acetyl-beta-L-altrosamine N-acetyltransferase
MVELRPLSAGDRDMVREWRNQPHVAAMMYTDHEIGAEEHASWFATTFEDPRKLYYIIEDAGEAIGLAGFTELDGRSASWAFYLASAETRGRGLGAQTEFAMLSRAFEMLRLQRLRCEVLALNGAVIALHESFGFRRTGLLAGHALKNGRCEDVVTLEMRAEDWPTARARAATRLAAREPVARSA